MLRRSLGMLLLLFVAGSASAVHAERIYRLVNYPDLQNGHTLSGTITTTDAAPDDGLLATEEIIDWEWQTTGAVPLMASFDQSPPEGLIATLSQGVAISPTVILLSRDTDATLSLRDHGVSLPPSSIAAFLQWRSFEPTIGADFRSIYSLYYPVRDSPITIWGNELLSPSADWVIATAVPEPSAKAALIVLVLVIVQGRSYCNSGTR